MENNKKSIITKILMGVGVLFVVISVSLFVKSTWDYWSVGAKAAGLAVIAVICFGVSALFWFKRKMEGMSSVFYYLGSVMAGAFVLMLGGGINAAPGMTNFMIALFAAIMVAVLLAIRTVWVKREWDFAFTYLALQMIPVLMGLAFEGIKFILIGYTLIYMVVVAGYLYFDHKKKLVITSMICYWIQVVFQAFTFGYAILNMGKSSSTDAVAILIMLCTLASASLVYIVKRQKKNEVHPNMINDTHLCRVAQTLFAAMSMICVSVGALDLFEVATYGDVERVQRALIVSYGVIMIGMALFGRSEAFYIQISSTILMSMLLIALTEYPYVGLLAAAGFGLDLLYQVVVMKRKHGQYMELRAGHLYGENFEWNTLAGLTIGQLVLGITLVLTRWCTEHSGSSIEFDSFRWLWLSLISISWCCMPLIHHVNCRRVLHMINMLWAIGYVSSYRWIIRLSDGYITLKPQIITALALGCIASLSIIWKDVEKKLMSDLQFGLFTVVFSCDVIYTCFGDLYFLLFFGIIAGIVLIVAGIRSNKRYAVVSSISLCLMVLYQTRWFWLSIAWWIYLFVLGVTLVTYASVRAWRSKEIQE